MNSDPRQRTRLFSIVLTLFSVTAVVFGAIIGKDSSIDRSREWQFVKKVLLSREFGARWPNILRWSGPITLRIVDANVNDAAFTGRVVEDLNHLLENTKILIRIEDSDSSDVTIMFTLIEEFSRIAKIGGYTFVPGGGAIHWLRWDRSSRPHKGFILIGVDLETAQRKAAIVQELTQVLGPSNDSSEYSESVMYESGNNPSTATELAPIDRKLLRFLYRHLKPGDDVHAVRSAFDMYWDSVPSN